MPLKTSPESRLNGDGVNNTPGGGRRGLRSASMPWLRAGEFRNLINRAVKRVARPDAGGLNVTRGAVTAAWTQTSQSDSVFNLVSWNARGLFSKNKDLRMRKKSYLHHLVQGHHIIQVQEAHATLSDIDINYPELFITHHVFVAPGRGGLGGLATGDERS